MVKYDLVIKNGSRLYRVKQGKEPWQTFKDGDSMPEEYKAVFDRIEANLEAFENDPKTKEAFTQMEKELKTL